MTPASLLAASRDLLEDPAFASVSGWPRAVALLTRQALETAIEQFWTAHPATAGVAACSRKTQLACLPAYLQLDLAREVSYVWAALSNACHYHPYELSPTSTELRGWIETTAALLQTMGNLAPN